MSSKIVPGRRERQAEATRIEIMQAARTLFAGRGYGATTVAQIARAAGVSPQTIYDSVGSKSRIVLLLNDLIDREAGVGELAAQLATANDPHVLLDIPVEISARILERCGDIVRAAAEARNGEPELAAVLKEGQRRHEAGSQRIAERLHKLGVLRLSADDAAATLNALTDVVWWLVLADDYGWDVARIRQWALSSLERLLLTDEAAEHTR